MATSFIQWFCFRTLNLPAGPTPIFTKELRNEKVKIGGSITLECRGRNSDSVSYLNNVSLGQFYFIDNLVCSKSASLAKINNLV